jgi:hypothetical protein
VFGFKETAEAPADQKDQAGEGRTDYLEREKSGTGVNVCVCRLSESAKQCHYQKYL